MSRDPKAALAEAEQRAVAARSIADSPALLDAFQRVEEKFIAAWRNSRALATEEREQAWHMLKALDALKAEIAAALVAPGIVRKNIGSARTMRTN